LLFERRLEFFVLLSVEAELKGSGFDQYRGHDARGIRPSPPLLP
jgi:hypothetical protein